MQPMLPSTSGTLEKADCRGGAAVDPRKLLTAAELPCVPFLQAAPAGNGAANPVPYSQRKPIAQPGLVGSLAKQPPASPSLRPSFRPTSRQPTASPAAAKRDHATRVMPAGAAPPVTPAGYDATLAQSPTAAPAGGLSAEQAAFVQRKAAEVRSPPLPTPVSPDVCSPAGCTYKGAQQCRVGCARPRAAVQAWGHGLLHETVCLFGIPAQHGLLPSF